ncbi:MAG: bifunctional YncE family protein/alkaline phosphatase family protein [Armatimonadetes bacterium]|nr:bifunctional YncE family protein/alkaline phosphatase family protein [Armatimonadota bacterium]
MFLLPLVFMQDNVSADLMATYELLKPAGKIQVLGGRPVDFAFNADQSELVVKTSKGIMVLDGLSLELKKTIESKNGNSQIGIVQNGGTFLTGDSDEGLMEIDPAADKLLRTIAVGAPKSSVFPCGVVIIPGNKALVCLSMNNSVAEVDLATAKVIRKVAVGIAPFSIAYHSESGTAFVSCQGGNLPKTGSKQHKTGGTMTEVDDKGVAKAGTVVALSVAEMQVKKSIPAGLQPGVVRLSPDSKLLAVCNVNSDSVSLMDAKTLANVKTWSVKPDKKLTFGTMPNGLAFSGDGRMLYVSLSGNNALGVYDISKPSAPKTQGFIPTAWFPSAIEILGSNIYVACTKGIGSRAAKDAKHNTHQQTGAMEMIPIPTPAELKTYTNQVTEAARIPMMLKNQERTKAGAKVKHVVYVIKENRTYDQVFGDIPTGNGDPKLCVFGEKITPNQHRLAKDFVLLDNYYCNGVLSADGHQWAIQGIVTPYLERAFGGFSRTYDFGGDAITYAPSGFLWDPILDNGFSFRNFGELTYTDLPKDFKLTQKWRNYENDQTVFPYRCEIDRLDQYSSKEYPGWEMGIPDVLRYQRFDREFKQWEASGTMPNLTIVYLPQDHTAGTSPGYPTAASYVADNDLAVGKLVDRISHSKFWKDTVIFINEDDPQAGFDHVDGHRSTCLVVGPMVKRGVTNSNFYNQSSVFRTILNLFGLPPTNQKAAIAPLMSDLFTTATDVTPFNVLDPQVDLAFNPSASTLKGEAKRIALACAALNKKNADFGTAKEDDLMNRAIWMAMKGNTPYPAKFAGAHGRGLGKLGLKRDGKVVNDD